MLTEEKLARVFVYAMFLLATGLVIRTLVVIYWLFTPIPYWDQWEMAKYLSAQGPFSLSYMLEPHAEHIIATSKILYFIDYWYFGYANRFLVATIVLIHLLVAYTLASVLAGSRWSSSKLLWFSVFGAFMLSLAQWENLTIGFQTQFGLTSLFAIISCILATRLACETMIDWRALVGLVICTPLTVFSMGNGLALVCCFTFIAVFTRTGFPRAIVMILIYSLCLVVFVKHHNGGSAVQIDGNNPLQVLQFFMAVLGGSFTRNFTIATVVGVVICLLFLIEFVYVAVLPWFRRQAIDRVTVVLLSIGIFVLASAAAVTIGRISLGPVAALTSRYATPNMLLYSSLLGIGYRHYMLTAQDERFALRLLCIFGSVGIVVSSVLTFRPSNLEDLTARSDTLTTAGYFLLAGVKSDDIVVDLYPRPSEVSRPIEFIEQNKINIFSSEFGLPVLGRTKIANVKELPICSFIDLNSTVQTDSASWKVSGKINHLKDSEKPDWIISTTLDGRVLGYAPLKKRYESGVPVFDLPVHVNDGADQFQAYVVALTGLNKLCRQSGMIDLSESYLMRQRPQNVVKISYDEKTKLGSVGLLPGPAQSLDPSVYKVRSTWQGNDAATGTISYSFAGNGNECADVFVGIMRGPTTDGLAIEVSEQGKPTRSISLDTISEHEWWWLKVRNAKTCNRASGSAVTLIDSGSKWGAWAAITTPVAASR